MRCAKPNCNRGIGLLSYRRGWLDKRRFCSRKCCDDFNVMLSALVQPQRHPGSYFEWLFAQAVAAQANPAISVRQEDNRYRTSLQPT